MRTIVALCFVSVLLQANAAIDATLRVDTSYCTAENRETGTTLFLR